HGSAGRADWSQSSPASSLAVVVLVVVNDPVLVGRVRRVRVERHRGRDVLVVLDDLPALLVRVGLRGLGRWFGPWRADGGSVARRGRGTRGVVVVGVALRHRVTSSEHRELGRAYSTGPSQWSFRRIGRSPGDMVVPARTEGSPTGNGGGRGTVGAVKTHSTEETRVSATTGRPCA